MIKRMSANSSTVSGDRGRPAAPDRKRRARRALTMKNAGSTWDEIGKKLGLTRQGARQLVLRARLAGDLADLV